MSDSIPIVLRDAELPREIATVERLWLAYLSWGNDENERRYGLRLPVRETLDQDLATIAQFQPPDGRIVLAFVAEHACGIGCLRRIGPSTGEIKRMFVEPAYQGRGVGRAILEHLIAIAREAGHARVRLDSVDFMTSAHALYRRLGFVEIPPYAESQVPDVYRPHLLFMERTIEPSSAE